MKYDQQTRSATVKAGMLRVCSDFTKLVASLGFRRTNSRSRAWAKCTDRLMHVIYFHRCGSTYGAPISNTVDIRVHFSFQNFDGSPASTGQLTSEKVRDSRGYAYHLRFNAMSWSMYERCLEDLIRITKEHGLPWFQQHGAEPSAAPDMDSPIE